MSRLVPRDVRASKVGRTISLFLAVAALVLGFFVPVNAPSAAAAGPVQSGIVKTTLAGFSAGNIMSDAVFFDEGTMTAAQMQTFFNGKVANCQSGYVCLKDYKQNTPNRPADTYCKGYTGAANESAATIIYKAAQSCGINPQVLVVMLQKEQSLITHTWPSTWRYDMALGQGCPDTAPCDPAFSGFFYQIYGAARQMQIYAEGRYFQWYAPGKTWNIQYHPNTACGSSPVYIANKATAALYYYTPYQPNAAALRAGYGTGDSCSAYGNRNFYNYFTDWFGSTQTPKPAPAPAVTVPALTALDRTAFATGLNTAGDVMAYPYTQNTWGRPVKIASLGAAYSEFYAVGDLNGDARRDFVAVSTAGKPAVLSSNGTTTLTKPVALPLDWSGTVLRTPAGDFSGDKVPDFFATAKDGRLLLYRGNDAGGFSPAIAVGVGWGAMNAISGGYDMTGDGKPDLVARDTSGNLYVYPGNGLGGFGKRITAGVGWSSLKEITIVGDFTGDGKADLVATEANGNLRLYRGVGGGAITSVGVIGNGWNALRSIEGSGVAVTGLRPIANGVGDITGDGRNDLVTLNGAGGVKVYGGNGAAGWTNTISFQNAWGPRDKLVSLGDFNGDGFEDVGRVTASGNLMMYAGAAGGAVKPGVTIGVGWQIFTQVFGGIDFTGDRKMDLIGITADGVMRVYSGNGAGGWANGSGSQIGKGWQGYDQVGAIGDFNGDGRADIFARRVSDGALILYPTTGSGAFGAPVAIGKGWGSMRQIFSPGDFSGDGIPDVLAVRADGILVMYPGNGKNGWGTPRNIGIGWAGMVDIV